MIGIIVVGHNEFGKGLTSAVELIAGAPENYETVIFDETMSIEALTASIQEAVVKINADQGTLVFTDLMGGSPFKAAMLLTEQYPNLHVFTGSNLGMLIEANLMRAFSDDIDGLAAQLVETGKSQVQHLKQLEVRDDQLDMEDGI